MGWTLRLDGADHFGGFGNGNMPAFSFILPSHCVVNCGNASKEPL